MYQRQRRDTANTRYPSGSFARLRLRMDALAILLVPPFVSNPSPQGATAIEDRSIILTRLLFFENTNLRKITFLLLIRVIMFH